MRVLEHNPLSGTAHGFKYAVAIPKGPVVVHKHGLTGVEEFPVKTNFHRGKIMQNAMA